jgi:hypothetical protein
MNARSASAASSQREGTAVSNDGSDKDAGPDGVTGWHPRAFWQAAALSKLWKARWQKLSRPEKESRGWEDKVMNGMHKTTCWPQRGERS